MPEIVVQVTAAMGNSVVVRIPGGRRFFRVPVRLLNLPDPVALGRPYRARVSQEFLRAYPELGEEFAQNRRQANREAEPWEGIDEGGRNQREPDFGRDSPFISAEMLYKGGFDETFGSSLECFFALNNDPALKLAGVDVGARVEVFEGVAHNRIVFRRGRRETEVSCVHTAIYTGTLEGFPEDEDDEGIVELAKSSEFRPVDLPPSEHFFALKSYVAGLAEMGILNAMSASYISEEVNPYTLPIGFNAQMHAQIRRALHQLVPKVLDNLMRDFLLELFEKIPEEWLRPRVLLLHEHYHLLNYVSENFLPQVKDWIKQDG